MTLWQALRIWPSSEKRLPQMPVSDEKDVLGAVSALPTHQEFIDNDCSAQAASAITTG